MEFTNKNMLNFLEDIKLKFFYRLIMSVEILFLILIFIITIRIGFIQSEIINNEHQHIKSLEIGRELQDSSDELTLMARLYTATSDKKYKKYFFDILAIRNGELARPENYSSMFWNNILVKDKPPSFSGKKENFLSRIEQFNLSEYEKKLLKTSLKRSDKLIDHERTAFYAVEGLYQNENRNYTIQGKPNPSLAQKILSDKEYLIEKNKIYNPILDFIDVVNARYQDQLNELDITLRYNILYLQLCIGLNLFFAFFALILINHSANQLNELTNQVNSILNGNYTARNRLNIKNEFGLLGNALNKMCNSIQSEINEHKQMNNTLRESEERFRSMVENSPIGTVITDLKGNFIFSNDAMFNLLGYTKEELLKMNAKDITYPEDLPKESELINQLIEKKIDYYRLLKKHIHKEGSPVWTLLNVTTIKSADGTPLQFTAQLQDISEQIRDEKRMAELNESLLSALSDLKQTEHEEMLLNKMNELLQVCLVSKESYSIISITARQLFPDLSGGISILNKTTQTMETVEQWGGDKVLFETFLPNDCFAIRSGNIAHIDNVEQSIVCHHYISSPQGGYIGLPMIIHDDIIGVIHLYAKKGNVVTKKQLQLAIVFNNIVKIALANIRLRELLREQSMRDPLTGLYNRRYLNETLPRILQTAMRNKLNLCVGMLDLDLFKKFNDTYGHEAGDEVLKSIGKILQQNFRGSDIVCRYGGEEFLVVMFNSKLDDTVKKMQLVREEVKSAKILYQEKTLPQITISIGIAAAPEHATTVDNLINASDRALYDAKESGRDQVKIFNPETNKK